MGLLANIVDKFNGTAPPSEGAVRLLVARTKTREGRLAYLEFISKHRGFIYMCDKDGNTALKNAARDGDVEAVDRLVKLGAPKQMYDEALHAAAHGGRREAFDLLIASGAVVTPDHLEIAQDMASAYGENAGPDDKQEKAALAAFSMLKNAYAAQEEKRAVEAGKPPCVELQEKITVRGPLRLKMDRLFGPA